MSAFKKYISTLLKGLSEVIGSLLGQVTAAYPKPVAITTLVLSLIGLIIAFRDRLSGRVKEMFGISGPDQLPLFDDNNQKKDEKLPRRAFIASAVLTVGGAFAVILTRRYYPWEEKSFSGEIITGDSGNPVRQLKLAACEDLEGHEVGFGAITNDIGRYLIRLPKSDEAFFAAYKRSDETNTLQLVRFNCSDNAIPNPIRFDPRDYEIALEKVITFAPNSHELSNEAIINLSDVFEKLDRQPASLVIVEGHADRTGPSDRDRRKKHNMKLSEQRIESALKKMRSKNLKLDRIITAAFGDIDPLVDEYSEQAYMQNRRVQIYMLSPLGAAA